MRDSYCWVREFRRGNWFFPPLGLCRGVCVCCWERKQRETVTFRTAKLNIYKKKLHNDRLGLVLMLEAWKLKSYDVYFVLKYFHTAWQMMNLGYFSSRIVVACKNIDKFASRLNLRWIRRLKASFCDDTWKLAARYSFLVNSFELSKTNITIFRVKIIVFWARDFNLQICRRFSAERNFSVFLHTMAIYSIFEKKSILAHPLTTWCKNILQFILE